MRNPHKPIAVSIEGAVQMSGFSRTRIYELIGAGELEARKAGRATLVMTDSIDACLSKLPPAAIRAPRKAA